MTCIFGIVPLIFDILVVFLVGDLELYKDPDTVEGKSLGVGTVVSELY